MYMRRIMVSSSQCRIQWVKFCCVWHEMLLSWYLEMLVSEEVRGTRVPREKPLGAYRELSGLTTERSPATTT